MVKKAPRIPQARCAALAVTLAAAACAAPRSPLPSIETAVADLQPAFTGESVVVCLGTAVQAQRPCRDRIAQSLLVAIDLRYAEYELGFFDANRTVSFGSSVALLGLGAAGSLAATGTAQVISAISGAVTGTREAFGRDFLVEQTSTALLTAMRAQRNMIGVRIREGLQAEPARYPLGVALSDLYAYFRAGTIPGALAGVTQAVGVQGQQSQQDLRLAVVGQGLATTPLAVRLRAHLDGSGLSPAVREQRLADFQRAKRAEGLDAIPDAVLLRDDSPQGEQRRARLAARLGL
jgi:hypothetical protein